METISKTGEPTGAGRTILAVEDEPAMLYLLERTFTEHGYAVVTAANGEEAIDAFRAHKTEIDLVFLDVGLPKIRGMEVLDRIKRLDPHVRVVIASGYLEAELSAKMQDAGVEHFIQKPYMLDQVVATVEGLIKTA